MQKETMATEDGSELTKAKQLNAAVKNVSSPAALYEDCRMTMDASSNWEQLLSPAPLGISVLGDLMAVASTLSDFRLDESTKRREYKYIKYPESFRASLVQLSNSGYQAFLKAHTNMDQVRLYSASVPSYMGEATKILMSKNPKQIPIFLPTPLERIKEAAQRNLSLSVAVTQSFEQVMGLTGEILEAVTATKGFKEQQNDEIRTEKEILEMKTSSNEKWLEDSKKHKEKLEKMVEETQNELREARQQMPGGFQIIAMNTLENFSDLVTFRFLKNIAQSFKKDSNEHPTTSVANVATDAEDECLLKHRQDILDVSNIAINLYKIAIKDFEVSSYVMLSKEYDGKTHLKTLQEIAGKSSECPELEEICEEGIEIIKTLQNNLKLDTLDKAKEMIHEIKSYRMKAKNLANKVTSMGSIMAQRTPYMSRHAPISGPASNIAAEQARQHVECAAVRLKEVRQSAEKAREEMMKLNKEHIEALAEMQRLKVSEINYKEAIKLLQKGLRSLGEMKDRWSGLVLFFSNISNVVEVIMNKSLTDFNKKIENTGKDLDLLDKVTLDLIYISAMKASHVSYWVHNMADTYINVSNKFIMPNIARLDQMIALDRNDPVEFERKRAQLLHSCETDSEGIIALIMEKREALINQAEGRMNTIKDQFTLLTVEDNPDHIDEPHSDEF